MRSEAGVAWIPLTCAERRQVPCRVTVSLRKANLSPDLSVPLLFSKSFPPLLPLVSRSLTAGTFCALAHEYHPFRRQEIAGACHSSTLSSLCNAVLDTWHWSTVVLTSGAAV